MAQHGFNQFSNGHSGASIDPNDLAMSGGYSPSFNNNFNSNSGNGTNGFTNSSAMFDDDELLDGLNGPPVTQSGMAGGQDFSGLNMGGFSQNAFSHRNSGLQIDQSHMNGYSSTPDGDPMQSPFNTGFNTQYRQMPGHSLGTSLHSPLSYSESPLAGAMNADSNDPNYLNAKARARVSQQMQRKTSNNSRSPMSPMTPKTATLHGMTIGSQESPGFGGQAMKPTNGQWLNTPAGSIPASYNSGFSSPMQPGMNQISEVMMKGGTSMPAKLGVASNAVSSQEMKRKRRRESHNLVERRRRDNINERIQDLSRLVPTHRLEDEKIRKLIQNGTPLSPSLTGISSPQATSGLAGPGARRATGATAGNITTGLPIEDKDKGPNKGDILNGAVSWTRDLMWMLHLKLQQQEEMMNTIADLGGHFPFEMTEDERRMQTELMDAFNKSENGTFSYSRTAGTGLRVPHHTDYRGESLSGGGGSLDPVAISPDDNLDLNDTNQFWHDPDDNNSGHASVNFKEEDEYGMDLTH